MTFISVIMAGGSGTRLWPLSRMQFPKQFLNLTGEFSLFQSALQRATSLGCSGQMILSNEDHRFIVAEQARAMIPSRKDVSVSALDSIILEPVGRNTAPAIALAALHATSAGGGDSVMLVLAADHLISSMEAFRESVDEARRLASKGYLVAFGIVPTSPETGYGYIRANRETGTGKSFPVQEFVEKPDIERARSFLKDGGYFWNSGMFMFKACRYLEELALYRPDILEACRRAYSMHESDRDFLRVDADAFQLCPAESIDYAVMEKTDSAYVVPLDAGWSDVGSWSALWEVAAKDDMGNACRGDVLMKDTVDCYVHADHRLVTIVGAKNLVIVETPDAVLVADKNQVQEVKALVGQLVAGKRGEYRVHRKVYRPWGSYDSLDIGTRFQVKRIIVNPGEKISVQMHHHRAEHWVVVAGTARVVIDGREQLLTENQSVYIPIGSIHSLENPGKLPLELIEVQSGSYLGEDDIVRFEDRYGRA